VEVAIVDRGTYDYILFIFPRYFFLDAISPASGTIPYLDQLLRRQEKNKALWMYATIGNGV
jgi:hypothetical protein